MSRRQPRGRRGSPAETLAARELLANATRERERAVERDRLVADREAKRVSDLAQELAGRTEDDRAAGAGGGNVSQAGGVVVTKVEREAYRVRAGMVGRLVSCICTYPVEKHETSSGHHERCPSSRMVIRGPSGAVDGPSSPRSVLLVPLAEVPGVLRESIRAAMAARGVAFVRCEASYAEAPTDEDVLCELGNNAAMALTSIDENPENQ